MYNKYISKLQVCQNNIMRAILKCRKTTSTLEMLSKLNWLSIKQLITYHSLIVFYRIFHSGEPNCIAERINTDYDRYNVYTRARSNNNIILDDLRLKTSKASFIFRVSSIWNTLPPPLRNIHEAYRFKKALKSYIKLNVPAR